MNLLRRFRRYLNEQLAQLAPVSAITAVSPVPVGRENDGLVMRPAGTPIDKPWGELYQEFNDAREAWSRNPLARRITGMITSYTVGPGMKLQAVLSSPAEQAGVQRFLDEFWQQNNLDLRLDEWSDEIVRSGELFPVLFTNPVSGMSTVRAVPACLIESIDYDGEDYETELRYRETRPPGQPEKWWTGTGHPRAHDVTQRFNNRRFNNRPLMLHYAVNRPVGAIRGESDLAPMLPWLRRYSRWLEDRVRLNAAVRAFLWVVHAPARLRTQLEERYRQPPEPGSVIIAEDVEQWEAITPKLNAADAEKDGRAIRWMIVAGGPGTALLDIGEGEDSNLATGRAMAEQRRRFLRRRQAYLAWMLRDMAVHAYRRYAAVTGVRPGAIAHRDIHVITPDISPEDNHELARAAAQLAGALHALAGITGQNSAFRKMALRLFVKFAGEQLSEEEFEQIVEGEVEREQAQSEQGGVRSERQEDAGSGGGAACTVSRRSAAGDRAGDWDRAGRPLHDQRAGARSLAGGRHGANGVDKDPA